MRSAEILKKNSIFASKIKIIQRKLKIAGNNRNKFRNALFDMDGVLYNSMPYHAISYHEALLPYGIDMSEMMVYECEGKKGVDTMKLVAELQWGRPVTDSEAEEMYVEKCRLFRAMPQAEKIPGVERLMRRMHESGWNICVVTGSGQLSLLDKLTTDFAPMITHDRIICSKDYTNGKPAPDPYLMGLQRLGARAEETIVVENAPLGVRAGRAAGIFTMAVNTGPLPRSIFEDAGANIVFDTMQQAEAWLFESSPLPGSTGEPTDGHYKI